MELEMVLNELSLQPLARNIPEAQQRMSDLISTMKAATRAGVNKSLRTHQDLKPEPLAPDYLLVHWLNDHEVDLEARRYFKSLAFHAPYLVDINNDTVRDTVDGSDFFYNGDCAIGLGVAYCLDALALSMRSDACWHSHQLELRHTYLDSDGEILSEDVIVTHASHKDHILTHTAWIGGLLDIQLKGSVDSEATLLKYSKERTFSCPDGQTRLFSLHIRITDNWRIYYYLEGSTKQLIIGYIGKHLPTVKYS